MKKYIKNEKGEAIVEYILMLSVVAVIIVMLFPLTKEIVRNTVVNITEQTQQTENNQMEAEKEVVINETNIASNQGKTITQKQDSNFGEIAIKIAILVSGLIIASGLIRILIKTIRPKDVSTVRVQKKKKIHKKEDM